MRLGLQQGVWTAVLGVGGAGAIMVAPAQLWIGWSLVTAAGLLLLWGVRINGKHWWAYRKPNPRRISLNDVVRRVAYESAWAARFERGSYDYLLRYLGDPWKLLRLEVIRPLSLGDIQAWGIKHERSKEPESGPTEIGKSFWKAANFSPELMLTEPSISNAGGGEGAPIYQDIQLDRAAVEVEWPSRKRWWRKAESPFREIYAGWRAKWDADHQKHADWINQSASHKAGPSLFELWRVVEPLHLYQAACLWVGKSPPSDEDGELPPEAIPILWRLKKGIEDRDLPIFNDPDGTKYQMMVHIPKSLQLFKGTPVKLSNSVQVDRKDLRAFAESIDERPTFLFEDEE